MKIGIIGTGRVGGTLARLWSANEHQIMLGSRNPELNHLSLEGIEGDVQIGSPASAAEFGDVLVLAFPWFAATDIFREVGGLENKVVIDCINPLMSSGKLALGHKTSAAEEVQRWVPRALVVKAFNHIHWTNLDNPLFGDQVADAFYCSNHDSAKDVVSQLAQEMGFHPVDCGPLQNARLLEPLALFWIQMAYTIGLGTDFAIKLIHR